MQSELRQLLKYLASTLKEKLKLRSAFVRKLKSFKQYDRYHKGKQHPIEIRHWDADTMYFQISDLGGVHLDFSRTHHRDDKEDVVDFKLTIDQMSPNEVMDLLKQFARANIRRRFLDPAGKPYVYSA